jgi:hypothetical protein
MTWTYTRETVFVCPKGQYYLGDLCYALGDEIYQGVFGEKTYADGLYQKDENEFFMVAGTACGDGEYTDSQGRKYSVDAGIIGICPLEMAVKGTEGGHVVTFDKAFHASFYGGMFAFQPADWSRTGEFYLNTDLDYDPNSDSE